MGLVYSNIDWDHYHDSFPFITMIVLAYTFCLQEEQ